MTELSDDLRARFDAGVPLPELDDAAIGSVLRGARRRRRNRRLGGGGAVVAVSAALVAGAMSLDVPGLSSPAAPPADGGPVDATNVDVDGARLWLSATTVPPGAEVVGVLVDRTGTGEEFHQLASVERWEDGRWVDRGEPLLWCLATDACSAQVLPPGSQVDVAPELIEPAPGAPGPAMRMSTEGLEPGWYRITHRSTTDPVGCTGDPEAGEPSTCTTGSVAFAVLEIAADAAPPAPLPPLDEASLAVGPPVLAPGAGGALTLDEVVPDGVRPPSASPEGARVEAWVDGAWVRLDVDVALTGGLGTGEPAVRVPGLDPGAYRVVLTQPDGELWGRFWVVDASVAGRAQGR